MMPQISSTWVATDAMGCKLPGYKEAGKVKDDKFIALFYWTWHVGDRVPDNPVNVNDIVSRSSNAPASRSSLANTCGQSANGRLVVTMTLVRS